MNDGADVGDAQVVQDAIDARLDVRLDFRERRDERQRRAVARVLVLRHAHQPLTGERRGRSLRKRVHVVGHFMTVVGASELDGALRCMRKRHPRTTTAPRNALVGDDVVPRLATEIFGRDLLQLLDPVRRNRVRRARHRMRRLAAA